MPAKVSVCLPCYNCEKFVGETLESILSQTWGNVEVIVCDDGSVDRSAEMIRSYQVYGVKLIQQLNSGAGAARNRAFAASTGDYILFMDADDLISPQHIESLVDAVPRNGFGRGIAMGQWDRFFKSPSEARFPERATYHYTNGVEFLANGGWNMMQCAMFLLPRELLQRYGSWDPTRSPIDDFEFYSRIISKVLAIGFAPNAKLYYRSGLSGSLSTKTSDLYLEGKFNSLMRGTGWLLEAENSARTRQACSDVLLAFEYEHYPYRPDLRRIIRRRVKELGGSSIQPDGPPAFKTLQKYIGWKFARRIQHGAETLGLNGVKRQRFWR